MDHELLVHISTPATRQNDQLYRSLADAYLDFESYRRQSHAYGSQQAQHHVSSRSTGTPRISGDEVVPNAGSSSFSGNLNASIISTSKDSYGSFPSYLSSDGRSSGDDDVEEDEFPPTSSRLVRLEHIHRNWKAHTTPKPSAVSKQRSTKDAPSSPEDVDTAFIEDTQAAAQALQSQMPDSFEMGFEDTYEDDESDDDEIGNETQGAALEDAEPAEELPQSQLQDSSPMIYEDTDEDDEVARIFTQEVPLSPAKPDERTTDITTEESIPPRATSSSKVPAAVVNRRKSTRLEEAGRTARSKTSGFSAPGTPKPHQKSSAVAPEQLESLHSNDALKAVASPKVSTAVAKRRRSRRLEETSAAVVRASDPSKSQLEFSSAVPGQQEGSRLNMTSKPTVSTTQHNTSESNSEHESNKHDQFIDFTKFPFSVLAPEPKIGITSPGTLPSQITPYLATIKTQSPTQFKPIKKLRSPAPDTRGWWSIDCSQWPAQTQKDFWDAICELLTDGRLGWATSLHREIGAQTLGEIRLYCWGELVEHMWLVLWLCSKGEVEGAGLKWFDAWKTAVFEME
jgi:hypothetical protein